MASFCTLLKQYSSLMSCTSTVGITVTQGYSCWEDILRNLTRIIESQNGLCWKGPLEVIQFNLPAVSRTINQIRLLLSNLTLNVFRDGASLTSLGNRCQCLTMLMIKNFFFVSCLVSCILACLVSTKLLPFALLQQV